jgi:HEPN domain-containing protein
MATTRYFDQRERYSENPEVFTYDDLPKDFRQKVAYLFQDLAESISKKLRYPQTFHKEVWEHRIVRALGIPRPPPITEHFLVSGVSEFFIGAEVFFESSAISCQAIEWDSDKARDAIFKAIDDLNTLMAYYALGYEVILTQEVPLFQVMRKDRQFTHSEVVKPTLRLLAEPGFEHAEKQFLDAHREFQMGQYDDAITDAEASVETVLKIVLGVEEGNAKDLLKKASEEGYFPPFMTDSLNQWINLFLELPAIRNRLGDAHGKGKRTDDAELKRFARLAINLAATHIGFIVDEYQRRK